MLKALCNRRFLSLTMLLGCVLAPLSGYAHPMGNFSVNHYSRITLTSEGVEIRYILDLAEIPTYQEMQQDNLVAKTDDPKVLAFVATQGEQLRRGLNLTLDGKPMSLHLISQDVIFPPGAGGLPTMKMGFTYRTAHWTGAKGAAANLYFEDRNFAGHAGWKEIVVAAPPGMLTSTSVPSEDRSAELTNYPTDLLNSPPQRLNASIQFTLPSPPATLTEAAAAPPQAHAVARSAHAPKRTSSGSSAGQQMLVVPADASRPALAGPRFIGAASATKNQAGSATHTAPSSNTCPGRTHYASHCE